MDILTPRKKCPNPVCRWISTTTKYKCPICNTTLVSALSGLHETRMKTLIRRDMHGNVIENNLDQYPNKMNWEKLND